METRAWWRRGLASTADSQATPGGVIFWTAVAAVVAAVVLVAQTRAVGGDPAELLAAGNAPLEELISTELPNVQWDADFIHDGHRYYAIAVDLGQNRAPSLIGDPVYWYQRILYPVLASGFGTLSGRALLWSMVAWAVAGFAWATGATHLLARDLGLPWLSPLAATANVGAMLAVSLLTADPLALALFITGLWAWNRHREFEAGIWMALAILTKEVFLAPVAVIALFNLVRRSRRSALPYLLAGLPAIAWRVVLVLRFPGDAGSGGSLGFPGVGLMQALHSWSGVGPRDLLFTVLALLSMGIGIASIWHRSPIWKWILLPWVLVGLVSSHWVWDVGNNALRVLAPLFTLAVLAAIDQFWAPRPLPNPATP